MMLLSPRLPLLMPVAAPCPLVVLLRSPPCHARDAARLYRPRAMLLFTRVLPHYFHDVIVVLPYRPPERFRADAAMP